MGPVVFSQKDSKHDDLQVAVGHAPQTCGAVTLSFGADGGLAAVHKGAKGWTGSLGGFQYQALSSGNFTDFCEDVSSKLPRSLQPGRKYFGRGSLAENPSCSIWRLSPIAVREQRLQGHY